MGVRVKVFEKNGHDSRDLEMALDAFAQDHYNLRISISIAPRGDHFKYIAVVVYDVP